MLFKVVAKLKLKIRYIDIINVKTENFSVDLLICEPLKSESLTCEPLTFEPLKC